MCTEIRDRRRCWRTLRQVRLFEPLAEHEVLAHGNGRAPPYRERYCVGCQSGQRVRNGLGIASRPEDAVHATGIDRAEEILEVEAQHDVGARVTEREGDSRSPTHKPVRAF